MDFWCLQSEYTFDNNQVRLFPIGSAEFRAWNETQFTQTQRALLSNEAQNFYMEDDRGAEYDTETDDYSDSGDEEALDEQQQNEALEQGQTRRFTSLQFI